MFIKTVRSINVGADEKETEIRRKITPSLNQLAPGAFEVLNNLFLIFNSIGDELPFCSSSSAAISLSLYAGSNAFHVSSAIGLNAVRQSSDDASSHWTTGRYVAKVLRVTAKSSGGGHSPSVFFDSLKESRQQQDEKTNGKSDTVTELRTPTSIIGIHLRVLLLVRRARLAFFR